VPLLRLAAEGRGAHYSPLRGVIESSLRVAYHGDWPAALWQTFPQSCRVTCVRRTLGILPAGVHPLRVGFISDIHVGPTTPFPLLDAAFECLAREALDVLLLGGDYVFLDATEEKATILSALIRRVPSARKFAVLGNHDLWTRHAIIEAALRRAGVEILDNAHAVLESTNGAVAVVGLDEPWTGALDAERAVRDLSGPQAIIVLCHSPDGLPDAVRAVGAMSGSARGLYVCGHTHGGHVATPWGPVIVPGRWGKRYPHGFHRVPPFDVHVSRGVGGVEVPIRAYAAPEVAVFDLVGFDPRSIGEERSRS